MDKLRTAVCRGLAALALTTVTTTPLLAAEPAALLEDATPALKDMGVMESLYPGQVIELKPGQTVILAYLNSCLRETVSGGRVTIGAERSSAAGGQLKTEPVTPCGTSRLALSNEQARTAGAIVLRGPGPSLAPKPPQTLLTTAPAFMLSEPGPVVLQRTDRDEQPLTLDGARGAIDFSRSGVRLVRGATYRVEAGSRSATIVIDPVAVSGGALLSRLVRL
jgi:hypothetical protein